MNKCRVFVFALGLMAYGACASHAQLTNGSLDLTQATEITAGFFLPKPSGWENIGSRSITGPYEDEMSSEPWAGPAPTPVTNGGNANPPHPEGCGGADCGVFFKGFSGNTTPNGLATGHLQQAIPGVAGKRYVMTGWAGAETNFLGTGMFAIDFLNAGGTAISSVELNLNTAGLHTPNGLPFNYKQYGLSGISPAGTVSVRARASMLDAMSNPAGGGQAYVVDDFTLSQIPEPTGIVLGLIALVGSLCLGRRR